MIKTQTHQVVVLQGARDPTWPHSAETSASEIHTGSGGERVRRGCTFVCNKLLMMPSLCVTITSLPLASVLDAAAPI